MPSTHRATPPFRAFLRLFPSAALLLTACSREPSDSQAPRPHTAGPSAGVFSERSQETGLAFVHDNGMAGRYYICEIMGAGAALLDVDNDGDLDIYFVQGGSLGGDPARSSGDRLFRNELRSGPDAPGGSLRFTDVSETSGLGPSGYGMGVATGDVDNDGLADLYVTRFGPNLLLRNQGNGTFADVTAAARADDPRWSVGAVFFDYDRDGWLDLFIGNYLDFRLPRHVACTSSTGRPDYCGPQTYAPARNRLLHNRGAGTFEDVSDSSGIAAIPANTLGVVSLDADGDGWLDLYVANDGLPNLLWINRRDGTFEERAALAGAAVNARGRSEASMGIAVGDVEGDGDEDLFLTHLTGETNTLYVASGKGLFLDQTAASGLGPPSLPFTSFGTQFLDHDHDGALDLIVVSGTIKRREELVGESGEEDPFPFHQTKQLFRNLGQGKFVETTAAGGRVFELSEVGRGAATGDLDNDGDTDVVVTNNHGPARLLINELAQDRTWLGLRLLLAADGRDALGAWVEVRVPGRPPAWRRVRTEGSYANASDPRLLFGLADAAAATTAVVEVRWLDGLEEEWQGLELRRYHTLVRGTGHRLEVAPADAP